MFESYLKKLEEGKASPSNFSGQPVKPVGKFANSPIPKGYDAIQNMINKKLAAKKEKEKGKSEDEETHCHAAEEENCTCDNCPECQANQMKHNEEDAQSLSINQADWGDSYQEVKGLIDQVLSYGLDKSVLSGILKYAEEVGYTGEGVDNLIKLIQHFNQKGVQDS